MSSVVLDASVAVSLVIEEARSAAAAEAVEGREILVPEAFWIEVSNALVRKVHEHRITPADALDSLQSLRRLVEYSVPTEPLGAVAIALALDLDHTVYDCLYVAAAIAHQAPLLTADWTLHARAVEAGLGEHVILVG